LATHRSTVAKVSFEPLLGAEDDKTVH